jgi:monoterpene epsilon-lactone hydrolase
MSSAAQERSDPRAYERRIPLQAEDREAERALLQKPRDLPPIYIQVGTRERLLDDARRYAAAAASQGVRVQLDIWEELHHVFQLNVKELASSRRSLDQAVAFIQRCFGA